MTEIELYKFIQEWDCLTQNDGKEAILWIPNFVVDEFAKMLDYGGLLDEGGLLARFQHEHIALELSEICDFYDLNIDNVIPIN